MPRKIRLRIEYDGSAFVGWQIQRSDQSTIQAALEWAVFQITKERVRVYGAGRTDAGVHALGQVAHFTTESGIPTERFRKALNSNLPRDISVLSSVDATESFDSRRDARGKIYRYRILNRPQRSALERLRSWHIRKPLDLAAMRIAAEHLEGEHDFSSFRASGCAAKSPVRRIHRLKVSENIADIVEVEIFATAYLKQMVRNIVGTLVKVGLGAVSPDALPGILAARNRQAAFQTAPARGLYLMKIFYPDDPPPPDLLRLIPPEYRRDLPSPDDPA